MKKIIREDKKSGLTQITIADERWYAFQKEDLTWDYVPSVTWIAGYYPKGIAFYKWLANKGWNESEALKSAAGDKGSKVHAAITDLLNGKEVKMEDSYINNSTEKLEPLTLEEYEAIMSFVAWHKETNPIYIASDLVVFNKEHGYAGTVDYVCFIGNQAYIIDFKTSAYVWPEHELQISAYKHSSEQPEKYKLAILQLGYGRNKKGFKFNDIEDKFNLFLAARTIWKNETEGQVPSKKDYPLALKLGV